MSATTAHLSHFAKSGLRTLCYAYRDIPEQEYSKWMETFDAANQDLDNRKKRLQQWCAGCRLPLWPHCLTLLDSDAA